MIDTLVFKIHSKPKHSKFKIISKKFRMDSQIAGIQKEFPDGAPNECSYKSRFD